MAHDNTGPARTTTGEEETGIPTEQCLLVQDEIWRITGEAARSGTRLSVGRSAKRIARAFPASGLSPERIADALVFAAVDHGVLLEMREPARSVPTIDVPGILAFVGGKRKSRDARKRSRPTFAGVPIPVAT